MYGRSEDPVSFFFLLFFLLFVSLLELDLHPRKASASCFGVGRRKGTLSSLSGRCSAS